MTALTAGLAGLLRRDGPWAAAITRHTTAIQAARDLGDRLGQANALHDLGVVRRLTDDYPAAAQAHEQALGIYRDLGDRHGQANALNDLGHVRQGTGDYPAAAQVLEQALDIYRDLGSRFGQANAVGYLGQVRRAAGEYLAAAQVLEQALDIFRDLGDRGGEVEVLNEIGTVHRVSANLTQAEGCHRQALDLARAIASSWDEAHALAGLGRCALAAGHTTQAEVLLRQALEIFQRIGGAEVPGLLAELAASRPATRTVAVHRASAPARPDRAHPKVNQRPSIFCPACVASRPCRWQARSHLDFASSCPRPGQSATRTPQAAHGRTPRRRCRGVRLACPDELRPLAGELGDHELGSLIDFGAAGVIQVAAGRGIAAVDRRGELLCGVE